MNSFVVKSVYIYLFFLFSNHILCQELALKDESFEAFYDKFYSDTNFQLERIVFPLPGYNSDHIMELLSDSCNNNDTLDYFWMKNDWIFINTVCRQDTLLIRTINKPSDSIFIEKIYTPNSGFIIERKFTQKSKGWFLTYYLYHGF